MYNVSSLHNFVQEREWIEFLADDPDTISSTSVCLQFPSLSDDEVMTIRSILMEEEEVAWDIASYRDAPIGLRIWAGGTVDIEDLRILLDWIEFAYWRVRSLRKS